MSGSVLELGCFNARSLDYLSFTPSRYFGLDAGWENGLTEAQNKYPQHEFKKSTDPEDITGRWDIAIALETLEHLPRPVILEVYLQKLASCASTLIVTVPMEIGPLFAAKFLYKRYIHGYRDRHSFMEFVNQTLGRCDRVTQDDHRGFDYRSLVRMISKYYTIEKIEGVSSLPLSLSTQVGIRAISKIIPVA